MSPSLSFQNEWPHENFDILGTGAGWGRASVSDSSPLNVRVVDAQELGLLVEASYVESCCEGLDAILFGKTVEDARSKRARGGRLVQVRD